MSDLVGNSEDRFSRVAARMITYVTKYAVDVLYEQTIHRISSANKQTDCVEIC